MILNFFLYRKESINDVYALKRFFLLRQFIIKPNYIKIISCLYNIFSHWLWSASSLAFSIL